MKTFTTNDFKVLGVCSDGLARVKAFGGTIENTAAGWRAYIDANPDAWRAPLFTAWRLHKRGDISCPDLIWRVARIAFREQPERNAALRVYGETLAPDNWREARAAAADAYAERITASLRNPARALHQPRTPEPAAPRCAVPGCAGQPIVRINGRALCGACYDLAQAGRV